MDKTSNRGSLLRTVTLSGVAVLAIMIAGWTLTCRSLAAADPIIVIVNNTNPVTDLSLDELKKLFLSDRSRWDTGKAVAPVMVTAGAPERTSFLKIVCKMNDADLGKYFMQAAFAGKSAIPPKEVASASEVKSFVAGSPGGIGFVKASDLPSGDTAVKPVKVDGAAANDPGYKLKM